MEICQRLVAQWFPTGRVVCADSYFASVATAQAFFDVGLRFTGVVQTATRRLPTMFLSKIEFNTSGEFVSLKSENEGVVPVHKSGEYVHTRL